MTSKKARFIRRSLEIRRYTLRASQAEGISLEFEASFEATLESVPARSRIFPCECILDAGKWYCMRPNDSGRFVMVDGPFDSEQECKDNSICD